MVTVRDHCGGKHTDRRATGAEFIMTIPIRLLFLKKKINHPPQKNKESPTQIDNKYVAVSTKWKKNGNDYIDLIPVKDHDPKIMHALGNAVDLGPRNCYHSIRCKDIAQDLSSKRRFVLSYIYIPFAVPESLVESKSFEENFIRNRGLPHRETPRKDGPNFLKLFLRSQISDIDVAGTTGFHLKILYYR